MESITEQRGPHGDRRRVKHERSGWLLQAIVGAVLAAIVAFTVANWTAAAQAEQTRSATEAQIRTGLAVIEERQRNQYNEVIRRLDLMTDELREQRRNSR